MRGRKSYYAACKCFLSSSRQLVFYFFLIALSLITFPVARATVDDALSFAYEAALPYTRIGFLFREDAWGGDLGVKEQKAIIAQLFKGNEYWFCLATDIKRAILALAIYDASGKLLTSTKTKAQSRFLALKVVPGATGSYYGVITVHKSSQERTHWALIYGYR